MIKKTLAALALAFAGLSAQAAGPFDGIYAIPGTQKYYAVLSTGGSVVVGQFYTIPSSGIALYLGDGQVFVPSRADNWDLMGGNIFSDGFAEVAGQIQFGACNAVFIFDFTIPAGAIVEFTQTSAGSAQGINCASYYRALTNSMGGPYFPLVKLL